MWSTLAEVLVLRNGLQKGHRQMHTVQIKIISANLAKGQVGLTHGALHSPGGRGPLTSGVSWQLEVFFLTQGVGTNPPTA